MHKLVFAVLVGIVLCASVSEGAYRNIVYFTNWAQYRPCNKFLPANIAPIVNGLTHINYAFAKFGTNGDVLPIEWNDCASGQWAGCQGNAGSTLYEGVFALKRTNPNLKVVITFGGWSWGGVIVCPTFSAMARNTASRTNFINQSVKFARTFGFDGIDVDWEYPGSLDLGCVAGDDVYFKLLIDGLASAIADESRSSGKPRLSLSIAAPAGKARIDPAGIPAVANNLDFISVMTYDYHGTWENVTGLNSPLYDTGDMLSHNWTINYYLNTLKIPAAKLNLGFATYGHNFAIRTPSGSVPVGSPVTGGGPAGSCTGQPGTLAYYEIETFLSSSGVTKVWNTTFATPYAWSSSQWVGYDDPASFTSKLNFLKSHNLGGAMTWAVDLDDFANGYPLLNTIIKSLA